MNFKEYLLLSSREVETQLQFILSKYSREFNYDTKSILHFSYKQYSESLYKNNYLKGTFVKLGCDIARCNDSSNINLLAAAVEIVNPSFSLHTNFNFHDRFQTQSILYGDLGFFLSTRIIMNAPIFHTRKEKILQHFSQMNIDRVRGELLDRLFKNDSQERNVLLIAKLKFTSSNIAKPLIIGGILGGLAQSSIRALENFSENLGSAIELKKYDDSYKVEDYKRKAKKNIPDITDDDRYQDLLFEMIDVLTEKNNNLF